ncbi:molybdenum ABC transporter permease [Deinococcus daejeonensis]|uniref:Molybdenum transport system permease n=1 Tax=Deinococcus daejeonensis TaxID=1007098 RepID=A0ABQ2J2C7_9DEIO|nr:molybdenum ABC transporter permease [Deinococcus daejeonensis]
MGGVRGGAVTRAPGGLGWAGGALGALFAAFLLLPTLALLSRSLGADFWVTLRSPAVLDALRVSLWTTGVTLLVTVVTGTPLAFLLARREFPGRALLDALLDLPVVLPPVVAGLGLLLTFGRGGLLGPGLELAGVSLAFSPAAVVLAQLFTAAPFYLRAAKAGFAAVDRDAEAAALTDGAGRWAAFRFITWPLAFPFLLEGLVLTWARALGEFGATILFAGSLQGRTRTVTLAIYGALDSDLGPALVLSAVMVVVAFSVLLAVRVLAARRDRLNTSSPG